MSGRVNIRFTEDFPPAMIAAVDERATKTFAGFFPEATAA